jgi:hypothetical protein
MCNYIWNFCFWYKFDDIIWLFFCFLRHYMFRSMCFRQLQVTYAVDSTFQLVCNRFYTGKITYGIVITLWPIPVAAWCKVWVCCRSVVGIAGSNPAGVMDVCLLWVLCVVWILCVGLITRPEEFCRVWCVWVWSWSPDSEDSLTHDKLVRHKKIHCELGLLLLISVAKIRLLETLNDCMHIIWENV